MNTIFDKHSFTTLLNNITKYPLSKQFTDCLDTKTPSLGKSKQLVKICNKSVLKQQNININDRLFIYDNKYNSYKLDSFTMMIHPRAI